MPWGMLVVPGCAPMKRSCPEEISFSPPSRTLYVYQTFPWLGDAVGPCWTIIKVGRAMGFGSSKFFLPVDIVPESPVDSMLLFALETSACFITKII